MTSRSPSRWYDPGVDKVAEGVYRIPLALPNDGLRAVNVYAVEDGDGLVLIDAGWAIDTALAELEAAVGAIGHDLGEVSRILVTHVHRDHFTLALTVRRVFGARVLIGIGEQASVRRLVAGHADGHLSRMHAWGADELLERLRLLPPQPQPAEPYALPDEWISAPADICLSTRTLRAFATPGHTRGHVVFADADAGLLFAGDHVLPHITPSIGYEPVPADLPLSDYLRSLDLVRTLPDMRLLPAHGPVSPSVHARTAELTEHHEQRLRLTGQAVGTGGATAYEVAGRLTWTRRGRPFGALDDFNQTLAAGETAAHLDVLVGRGQLLRESHAGTAWYRPAGRGD